jgi:hypothetical protein
MLPVSLHPELQHHLSSLAVLHETHVAGRDPIVDGNGRSDPSGGRYYDEVSQQEIEGRPAVEKLFGNSVYHEGYKTHDSEEKTRALHNVRDAIIAEAEHDLHAPIKWDKVVGELFSKAKDSTPEEKAAYVVGSVIAAQFAPDRQTREQLVRSVYDENLQTTFAEACDRSSLALLLTGPHAPGGAGFGATKVRSVHHMSSVFKIDRGRLDKYLEHMPTDLPEVSTDMPDLRKAG